MLYDKERIMMNAETASAWAAWATVLVAVAAALFAYFQVRDARKLREEQAAPYVVAYMEVAGRTFGVIDFVVKNLGATGAHDITVTFNPEPTTTKGGESPVPFPYPKEIPFLAPGQEWRAAWDFGPQRQKAGLHEPFDVTIGFYDSKNRAQEATRARLDWALIWHQVAPNPRTLKHVVAELKKMGAEVKKIRQQADRPADPGQMS